MEFLVYINSSFGRVQANRDTGKEILKSFFGVTGPEENMTYSPGHERIPDNWYRRSDDYDVPGVGLDLVNMATKNPRVLG